MKNKIKILRILNRFNLGGPIYNATYLSKYINQKKYKTFLIGGIHEKHEKDGEYILKKENVDFKKLKFMRRTISPFYDLISFIQILIIILTFKPDIIHTHAAKAGLLGRSAAIFSFRKIKIFHTYHGNVFEGYFSNFMNRFIINIERFLAKFTHRIVAISKLQKNDLVNKYKICPEHKIKVIKLGFDLEIFSTNNLKKRVSARNEFCIDQKEVLVCIIGRLVKIKNHKLFIDVLKNCKQRTDIRIKGIVVGDGEELENLMTHSNKNNLKFSYKKFDKEVDIIFTSWRKDIDRVLAAADISCLTSTNEGTPVSIIESMASSRASISTDVGGVSDIITDSVDGFISDGTINDYTNKLLLLIEDVELRNRMGLKAKEKSQKNYNYNILVKNIENLYSNET